MTTQLLQTSGRAAWTAPVYAVPFPVAAPTKRAMRVAIVEDNEALALGLRLSLEAEGYDVCVASNGEEAMELVRDADPDVMLVDLADEPLDGFPFLRSLRGRGVDVPILMLDAGADEDARVGGLRLGADDYVSKPFAVRELLARVEALTRRSDRRVGVTRQREIAFGAVRINLAAGTVTRAGAPVALTPKELGLLVALAANPGTVLSRLTLLREVWGYTAQTLTRTVDIHMAELRRKLEDVPSRPRHLITVWKRGYRLDP